MEKLPGRPGLLLFSVLGFAAFLLVLFSSCTSLKTDADISVLSDVADTVLEEAEGCTRSEIAWKQPDEAAGEVLEASGETPEKGATPGKRAPEKGAPGKPSFVNFSDRMDPGLRPAGEPRWSIARAGEASVDSSLLLGGRGFFEGDRNRFYFFKPADWDGEKAILFVPGFGVSDFAFCFLQDLFREELERGYAVLVYNLPFHLDRVEPGKEEGQGLFTGSVQANLEIIRTMSEELNQGYLYLKEELGVQRLGGWGGSIGAAALSLLAAGRGFDHISLFIPVLNWNTLIFHPEFEGVVKTITGPECSRQQLSDLFLLISPVSYRPKLPSDRIMIQYARHDQLTPSRVVREYAAKRGIDRLHEYPESHSTILLNRNVYRDYAAFLQAMGRGQKRE